MQQLRAVVGRPDMGTDDAFIDKNEVHIIDKDGVMYLAYSIVPVRLNFRQSCTRLILRLIIITPLSVVSQLHVDIFQDFESKTN